MTRQKPRKGFAAYRNSLGPAIGLVLGLWWIYDDGASMREMLYSAVTLSAIISIYFVVRLLLARARQQNQSRRN